MMNVYWIYAWILSHFDTGDAADGMYFIEEGTVSIRIEQEAGEVEISGLGKGQYFGELALVTHRPRAASAYAATDVKVACKFLSLDANNRYIIVVHSHSSNEPK